MELDYGWLLTKMLDLFIPLGVWDVWLLPMEFRHSKHWEKYREKYKLWVRKRYRIVTHTGKKGLITGYEGDNLKMMFKSGTELKEEIVDIDLVRKVQYFGFAVERPWYLLPLSLFGWYLMSLLVIISAIIEIISRKKELQRWKKLEKNDKCYSCGNENKLNLFKCPYCKYVFCGSHTFTLFTGDSVHCPNCKKVLNLPPHI